MHCATINTVYPILKKTKKNMSYSLFQISLLDDFLAKIVYTEVTALPYRYL